MKTLNIAKLHAAVFLFSRGTNAAKALATTLETAESEASDLGDFEILTTCCCGVLESEFCEPQSVFVFHPKSVDLP